MNTEDHEGRISQLEASIRELLSIQKGVLKEVADVRKCFAELSLATADVYHVLRNESVALLRCLADPLFAKEARQGLLDRIARIEQQMEKSEHLVANTRARLLRDAPGGPPAAPPFSDA